MHSLYDLVLLYPLSILIEDSILSVILAALCKFVDHDLTIMNLTLYKASAGSGKTYTLTQAYIKQLLQPGTEARNILAITFTNAATSDMKRKIVEALAESAPEKLSQILHRYHEFSIKTIDSFVQNIIKPFAFELGLPRNYTPQIEEDLLAQDITGCRLSTCDPAGEVSGGDVGGRRIVK